MGHALSRVERFTSGLSLTRSSLSFNWATRSRAWKAWATHTQRQSTPCFNWATRSRAWKVHRPDHGAVLKLQLQLGHALSRVESDWRRRSAQLLFLCFNWATRSRAWKDSSISLLQSSRSGFNWATRSRAWKARSGALGLSMINQLQLGHALSRVERHRCKQ